MFNILSSENILEYSIRQATWHNVDMFLQVLFRLAFGYTLISIRLNVK